MASMLRFYLLHMLYMANEMQLGHCEKNMAMGKQLEKQYMNDKLLIAGREFSSRLMVGTGRYNNISQAKLAVEASGAEVITVAVRRTDFTGGNGESLFNALPPAKYTYLPNSAGCYTADEAVRTLRLAREIGENFGGWSLVKLEVIGDNRTLLPDTEETLKAAKILVKEGFSVMAYTSDDLVVAKKLEDAGCAAVMPLAAPIGSGLGLLNPLAISRIVENVGVPVLVDAGIGAASDACLAMELGCGGVLLNTAISDAGQPKVMAEAMKHSVIAGRLSYLAGRMTKKYSASPSSPSEGIIGSVG